MPKAAKPLEDNDRSREKPSLQATIDALRAHSEGVFNSIIYYGLSDLSTSDIESLKGFWESFDAGIKTQLLRALSEASEANFDLEYRAIGMLSLTDADPQVREAAIETLWSDESLDLLSKLIELAEWDESPSVRAAAASNLGRFILLGEYGDIPERDAARAQETVINLLLESDEEIEVRRRALEAIANSSHEIVDTAITEAYEGDDRLMKVSAIFAMGRTCDPRWAEQILREMSSPDAEMRYEAARAAGELELQEAVGLLGRLAAQGDLETRYAAIWSLGEIGGRDALRTLTVLAESVREEQDEDLADAIDEAIGNAGLPGRDLIYDDEG